MTRLLFAVVAVLVVSVLAWNHAASQAPQGAGKLPGARPAIEAINYPTLQAAIDALPPTGGIVRLPAGTFEIDQPLRISQEDVLIAGSALFKDPLGLEHAVTDLRARAEAARSSTA